MGTIVMIIVAVIYVYAAIRNYDKISEAVGDLLSKIDPGLDVPEILRVIALGLLLSFLAWIFWPLVLAVILGLLLYFWKHDKNKVKEFFKDLF